MSYRRLVGLEKLILIITKAGLEAGLFLRRFLGNLMTIRMTNLHDEWK